MGNAALAERSDAGGGLLLVGLDVDDAAAAAYASPGQYVEVTVPGANGYFVLAGDPGKARWELLVRNAGDAALALSTLPLGSSVEVSAPLGRGFPIEGARGRPLVVAVVGSAMAVARPVLRRRIAEGDAAITRVFLGVRGADELPIAGEVEAWAERGAEVILCISRAPNGDGGKDVLRALPRVAHATTYVQDEVARALEDGTIVRGTLVVAAGPETMLAAMRELASAHAGRVEIVTNV